MQKEVRISNVLLAVTTCLGLLLLALPSTSVVSTIKTIAVYCVHPGPLEAFRGVEWAKDVPANFFSLLETDQENRKLKDEYRDLQLVRSRAAELEEENERLRDLLGLEGPPGFDGIWAKVVSRDPAHWYRWLLIDKGREDGVEPNAPVVAPSSDTLAVVGQISELGPHTAKVLLITDDLSSIAVSVEGKWPALAEGTGGPALRLNYVSERIQLSTGDAVSTSDISPTFPPNLRIGRLTEIYPQDLYLAFQSARLEPDAELADLRDVMVLQKHAGGKPKGFAGLAAGKQAAALRAQRAAEKAEKAKKLAEAAAKASVGPSAAGQVEETSSTSTLQAIEEFHEGMTVPSELESVGTEAPSRPEPVEGPISGSTGSPRTESTSVSTSSPQAVGINR